MLGQAARFDAVPFFWSQHYDRGHQLRRARRAVGPTRDRRRPRGEGCTVRYVRGGKVLAVATVGRDRASLEAEAALEAATSG